MSDRRRIRPGTVLGLLALFVAMGGAAYAGSKVDSRDLATSAVTAKKIANGAVRANKLADGSVRTEKIAPGAVTNDRIADNAVTGAKVDESTLGEVPQAGQAGAVGGMKIQKFSVTPAINSPLTVVATVGSLEVLAGCQGGSPLLTVRPASGAPPQTVRSAVVFQGANQTQGNGEGTLPADGLVVLDGTQNAADGNIDAATTAGVVTSIQFGARGTLAIPSPNPTPNNCTIYGTAISG